MIYKKQDVVEVVEEADQIAVLQLVTGLSKGKAFWAYMAMNPAKHGDYMQRINQDENVDLTEYGTVLESGWGEEPSADIHQKIKDEYGFDDSFTEKIIEMIEKGDLQLEEKR